mmetsp:Transcript_32880/g.82954  ORF Transcript_32880/g.82954 Transcript_32880/m.82954 type:complete len:222 (-) Transcript_32880:803-1468(-)
MRGSSLPIAPWGQGSPQRQFLLGGRETPTHKDHPPRRRMARPRGRRQDLDGFLRTLRAGEATRTEKRKRFKCNNKDFTFPRLHNEPSLYASPHKTTLVRAHAAKVPPSSRAQATRETPLQSGREHCHHCLMSPSMSNASRPRPFPRMAAAMSHRASATPTTLRSRARRLPRLGGALPRTWRPSATSRKRATILAHNRPLPFTRRPRMSRTSLPSRTGDARV